MSPRHPDLSNSSPTICRFAMRKTPNAFPDEIFPDGKVMLLRSDVATQ
jgi:hypothetical protein